MPFMADLRDLWQRSMIAQPDGRRDTRTELRRQRGLCAYADPRGVTP
jgi:hypothetical protein